MAEIDGLDSFVRTTRAVLEEFPAPTIVLPRAAVEAFVATAEAHLRAPKGELEEARADSRYEEMARGYLERSFGRIDGRSYDGGPTSTDADNLEELIRTAAREAQVRVLTAVAMELLPKDHLGDAWALVDAFRKRLESGEDL